MNAFHFFHRRSLETSTNRKTQGVPSAYEVEEKKNKLGRNGFTRTLAGFTSSSKFYRVYGIGGGGMLEVRDRPL